MQWIKFPEKFLFGTATSSYQIEGAYNEDGKGLSIWDVFSQKKGTIIDGTTGNIACDHYHRYEQDIKLMASLGYNAYRFSISWSRVIPDGRLKVKSNGSYEGVNIKGLDFYNRLVDELLKYNIVPFITIFHWDSPYALEKNGGWINKNISDYYVDYVEVIVNRLKDRVKYWITLNEPFVFSSLGYVLGENAPGKKNFFKALKVIHNLNLAHLKAVDLIKSIDSNLKVGITNYHASVLPVLEKRDRKATDFANSFINELFLFPELFRDYPEKIKKIMKLFNKDYKEDDFDRFKKYSDFIGINNYTRFFITRSINPIAPFNVFELKDLIKKNKNELFHVIKREYNIEIDKEINSLEDLKKIKNGPEFTDMDWEIYPEGIFEVINMVDRYTHDEKVKKNGDYELFITENGAAFKDVVIKEADNKTVNDKQRIDFLKQYLLNVKKALDNGINLKGYFVWSFMDNFEWGCGLSKRFGLVYIDYKTQKSIVKKSGYWYGKVCKENGFLM